MAKIFGIHEARLREGVTGEELEEFIREEVSKTPFLEGWDGYLLRKRGGPRGDEYIIVWAIDEQRYPNDHPEVLVEYERWKRRHANLWARWSEFVATMEENILIADYAIAAAF